MSPAAFASGAGGYYQAGRVMPAGPLREPVDDGLSAS